MGIPRKGWPNVYCADGAEVINGWWRSVGSFCRCSRRIAPCHKRVWRVELLELLELLEYDGIGP